MFNEENKTSMPACLQIARRWGGFRDGRAKKATAKRVQPTLPPITCQLGKGDHRPATIWGKGGILC